MNQPFVLFTDFLGALGRGAHDFESGSYGAYLTALPPDPEHHSSKHHLSEIPSLADGGYPPGGVKIQMEWSQDRGVWTLTAVEPGIFRAASNKIGPFQAVVVYRMDVPGEPLVGFRSYPALEPATLHPGETLTLGAGQLWQLGVIEE